MPVIQGGPMLPSGLLPFQQNFEALKEAVGLTDDQVKKIREAQQSRAAASQAIYVQISAKQKEMNDLLAAGSTDAAAIGQLEIEMNRLRVKASQQTSSSADLLSLLNPAQKRQLEKLQEALQLQRAANEAVQLGLLQYPSPIPPKPVPVPLPVPVKKDRK